MWRKKCFAECGERNVILKYGFGFEFSTGTGQGRNLPQDGRDIAASLVRRDALNFSRTQPDAFMKTRYGRLHNRLINFDAPHGGDAIICASA